MAFNGSSNRNDQLTFDVVPKNGSVVVLSGGDLESGRGVSLAALVPGDDLNFSGVDVTTLRDVKVPHTVVDKLVLASLLNR